jgi:hypothetical protein
MTDDWQLQANTWINIAYSCMETPLLPKYQYHVLDRCLRGASDIISCETTAVHSNTASLIQWCKMWSSEALFKYQELKDEMTEERQGKPPTHRQICNSRIPNRKGINSRWFTCEHEYPMIIPKKGVRDHGWTLEKLREWMWTYSKVTIILNSENDRLLPFTEDMELAAKRYEDAGIVICEHPYHLEKDVA